MQGLRTCTPSCICELADNIIVSTHFGFCLLNMGLEVEASIKGDT